MSFFFTFLDQMKLPVLQLRYAVIAVFAALSCLPMIFTLLSPKVVAGGLSAVLSAGHPANGRLDEGK